MTPSEWFLRPGVWPVLLAAPVLWLAIRALETARARRLLATIGPRLRSLVSGRAQGSRRLGAYAAAAALFLAGVACLEPVWGEGLRTVEQRGVDVVVCLDVSRSMLARDERPSRLLAARREIRALARHVRADRLALVAFAGEARLLVPLTRDMDSFVTLLEQADPLSVTAGGTDLGAAIDAASHALQGGTGEHEVVIVVTDGEDLSGDGARAAQRCRDRGVVVHCVAFGSAAGAKIPVTQDGRESFLRDADGRDVVSAMDPVSLRRVADAGGGTYTESMSVAGALVVVHEERIAPLARKAFESEQRRERVARFQWPLAGAVLLWIVELCRWHRSRG